jgi:hypothetical protein
MLPHAAFSLSAYRSGSAYGADGTDAEARPLRYPRKQDVGAQNGAAPLTEPIRPAIRPGIRLRPVDTLLIVLPDHEIGMTSREQLIKRARQAMPGGVNSPVRAFRSVGADPIFAKSARAPC